MRIPLPKKSMNLYLCVAFMLMPFSILAQSFVKTDYAINGGAVAMAMADFNGDGKVDIAVGNYHVFATSTNGVAVLLNNGDNTYGAPILYLSGTMILGVSVGDIDGDGDVDMAVVVASQDQAIILLNNGNGVFSVSGNYVTGSGPTGICTGDFNNDGRPDVVVSNFGGSISVFTNNGNGTLTAGVGYASGEARQLAIGDLNNDGYLDIAVSNGSESSVSVFLNKQDGTFNGKVSYPTGRYAHYVAIGDLDGDGRNDLVVTNRADNTISTLKNTGAGVFAPHVVYNVGDLPMAPTIGDLNGDGKADIVVANNNSSNISVLLNNGTGTFNAQTVRPVPYGAREAVVRDLNGDGKNDMVVVSSSGEMGAVSVMINDGVLPVSLIDFTAKADGNHAKLQWKTASELNNKGFEIYRRGEDVPFVKIGEQLPATGEQSSISTYTFTDKQPLNGTNYYKLLQIDNDGETTELGMRSLKFSIQASTILLYPNPTDHEVNVLFGDENFTSVKLIDVNGKVLQQIKVNDTETSRKISLVNYPAGVYFVQLIGEDHMESKKVIKK